MSLFILPFVIGFFARIAFDGATDLASRKWRALTNVRFSGPDTDPPPGDEMPTEPHNPVPTPLPPAAVNPYVTRVWGAETTFAHPDAEQIICARKGEWRQTTGTA